MAESDRNDANRWRTAWRIISVFGVVLNFYSYFIGAEPRGDSIWRFSPWPIEAVFFSTGIVFLLVLIASSLPIIKPMAVTLWGFFTEPYRNAKKLEATRNQDVLKTMEDLRAFCYERASRNQTWIGGYEKIHRVEMENLSLALPEYATHKQWVVYLDRIMPFVKQHGLRQAKQEAQKWKWHKPPADIDDEVPF